MTTHSASMRCEALLQSQIARTNDYAGVRRQYQDPKADHQHVVWLRTANLMQISAIPNQKLSVHSSQCFYVVSVLHLCHNIMDYNRIWSTIASKLRRQAIFSGQCDRLDPRERPLPKTFALHSHLLREYSQRSGLDLPRSRRMRPGKIGQYDSLQ